MSAPTPVWLANNQQTEGAVLILLDTSGLFHAALWLAQTSPGDLRSRKLSENALT